jgi:predicted transcriptional regulator of viral defense system
MEGVWPETDARGPKRATPPDGRAIAALAAAQHGVVALLQLQALGLGARGVAHRVRRGALHRVHPGVYAVGHPLLTRSGRFMAAVLACGPGAALSHRSAACHLGLRDDNRATIDVTSPHRAGRRRRGIAAHSGATLLPRDVEVVDGIPCTALARTLLDLAEDGTKRELERAVDRAEILRILDMRPIDDVLARANGRRGAATLRAVLSEMRFQGATTRSDLEERFLEICRDAGAPPDGVNVWIPFPEGGGAEADFLWRAQRLIAETDGRDVHTTRRAFEHDRRRDQRLSLLGWRVVRFTWRQVEEEPAIVAATVGALAARHAAQRPCTTASTRSAAKPDRPAARSSAAVSSSESRSSIEPQTVQTR